MKMKEKTARKDKGRKNITGLIGEGFKLWWKNPVIILPFLFYILISLVAVAIIFLFFWLTFVGSNLPTGLNVLQGLATLGEEANFTFNESMFGAGAVETPSLGVGTVAVFVLLALVFVFVLLLSRAFFSSGAIAMAQEIVQGKKTSLETMKSAGKKFFWRYFLVELIISAGALLWFFVFSLPALIASDVWLLLITAASLIPFFFLFLFVYLADYLLVTQDLKPWSAIKRSLEVVKMNYAATLGLFVLFSLISLFVSLIPWLGELLHLLVIMPAMTVAFTLFVMERSR